MTETAKLQIAVFAVPYIACKYNKLPNKVRGKHRYGVYNISRKKIFIFIFIYLLPKLFTVLLEFHGKKIGKLHGTNKKLYSIVQHYESTVKMAFLIILFSLRFGCLAGILKMSVLGICHAHCVL